METMFWIWLAIIVVTAIIEICTTELVSIWFTFGSILPMILSATTDISIPWQIAICIAISAILIACLRKISIKFLFRNGDNKTNLDALIGEKFRLLERTDFETIGKVKVKDIEWSVVGDQRQTIEKGSVVEVVKISGAKLTVKEVEDPNSSKTVNKQTAEKQTKQTVQSKNIENKK